MAFDLGGFLGGVATDLVGSIFGGSSETPTSTPSTTTAVVAGAPGVTGASGMMGMAGGGGAGGVSPISQATLATLKPGAIEVLRLLGSGASDSQVRQAARDADVSKKSLFQALTTINFLGRGVLTRLERIAMSDQIERIFRPKRRPVISKQMKRTAKQMEFFMKLGRRFAPKGHAHFTTTTKGHK